VAGLAVAVAFVWFGLVVSGAFTSERRTLATTVVRATIPAVAAVSVFATAPDITHGGSRTLRVDSSPVVRTYLRFDLSRFTGRLTSARLSFDPLSANPAGLAVDLVAGGWTEDQVTYFTAPKPGDRIGLSGPLSRGVRSSIDLTRFVQGGRVLDLALVALSSQQIALAGRERGGLGPQLAVTLKGGTVPARAAGPGSAQASPAAGASQASPAAGAGPASLASAAKAATTGGMAAGAGHDPLVAAAGDIACNPGAPTYQGGNGTKNDCHERVTSQMLLRIHPTAVLPLGDEQYQCGGLSDFRASYGPTWGRLMAISHPVPGNHEYGGSCHRSTAAGYFSYFGAIAGHNERGWYSYNLGSWHLIALNSECRSGHEGVLVGGCDAGSAQEHWLRHDLATHQQRCTLAYWHEPRFSSGQHGDNQHMAAVWNDLARAHVDVVLSGHNHDYERFAPIGVVPGVPVSTGPTLPPNFQDPILNPQGIREFVVGTGGKNHYLFMHPALHGELVRNDNTYGLLLLRLRPHGYSWRFAPEPGKSFTDSGSGTCS
jgi:acid phosphatase type 7